MQKSLFHILLITISSLILVVNLSGQLDRFEIEYPYDKSVDAIGFDSLGFPWSMNTAKGKLEVIKYNGQQLLKSYFPKTLTGDYFGKVIFIKNRLLVGNKNKVYLFNPSNETYETLWDIPNDQTYHYSYQDDLGKILVTTTNNTSKIKLVYRYTDQGEFKFIYELPAEIENLITHYEYGFKDINGVLYLLYHHHGMLVVNQNGELQNLELADQDDFDDNLSCSVFKVDNKNGLWRIYKDKIELLNTTTRKFEEHPLSNLLSLQNPCRNLNERLRVRLIFRDKKNRVWIGGEDSHLYLYDKDSDQLTFFGKELVDNLGGQAGDIINLLEDNTGNIWGRKRGGIFKITEKKAFFEKYAVDTQEEDHPIYKDIPHINRTIERYGKFGKKPTAVPCIIEDSNGDIFFKDTRFLFRIDAQTKELEILPSETVSGKIRFFINDSIKILSIWSNVYTLDEEYKVKDRLYDFKRLEGVFQQKDGTLWYRGVLDDDYNVLFAKIDPSTLQYNGAYIDNEGNTLTGGGGVISIAEDGNHNLWVTSKDGWYKIRANDGLIIPQDSTIMYDDRIISIKKSSYISLRNINRNKLGLRLEDELAVLNTETFTLDEYVSLKKLGIPNINASYIDEETAWFTHGNNLSNYNFSTKEVVHFSSKEGLDVGDQGWTFEPLSNGTLALGTFNGLYIFHPDTLISAYKASIQGLTDIPLHLESYSTLDGKTNVINTSNYFTEDLDQTIELGHNDRMLELQFSLLNFDNLKEHHYSHWLEGYDNSWSPPITNNTIKYTSLPSGEYNLKVRAHAGNGIWSSSTLNIPVIVYAPWYKRWWAYMIFALLVCGTLYGIYRYQINQILKYQTLRTKISSDLHDDVGTLLSSLAMQSDVLGLGAPPEKLKRFEKFSELSREAMDRMRDTVWAIDSRKDNMVSLIDRMRDYISDMFQDQEIKVKFEHEVPKVGTSLAPDVRQNIYLIFKEALNNAMKYSNGNLTTVKLKKSSNHISLSIKDNGTVNDIKTSGLGISNMKMRAKRINGVLEIKTNDGFEVLLTVHQ